MTGAVLTGAVILVLLSAALSAGEAAVASIGSSRLRTLLGEGFSGADQLLLAREQGAVVQVAVRFWKTILDMTGGAAAVLVVTASIGPAAGIVAATVAVVAVVGTHGVARALGRRHTVRLALAAAPSLLRVAQWSGRLGVGAAPGEGPAEWGEEGEGNGEPRDEQLRELASLGRREGLVEEEEHLLVERAFRLDELAAVDVMTPRVDVTAWRDDLVLEEIIDEMRDVPYSRIPVYGESVDDITGVLYIREAYEAYVAGRTDAPLSSLAREPFFIPGSLRLTRLLRDFQNRRIHMGIVADEFGGTDGIVTLEDVLEELVGEIEDELDIQEEPLYRVTREEIVVDGATELREINYSFNVALPHMEHRSLSGYLVEELERVPQAGERLQRRGVGIEVLEASETQVLKARLWKAHSPAEEERKDAAGADDRPRGDRDDGQEPELPGNGGADEGNAAGEGPADGAPSPHARRRSEAG